MQYRVTCRLLILGRVRVVAMGERAGVATEHGERGAYINTAVPVDVVRVGACGHLQTHAWPWSNTPHLVVLSHYLGTKSCSRRIAEVGFSKVNQI